MSQTSGIGIIGGGVVGEGVYQLLTERRESLTRASRPYEVLGVAVKDVKKPRQHVPAAMLTTPDALLADPRLDLLVEVAGGVEEPFGWVKRALEAGKTVVTANKALLAERAEELHGLIAAHPGKLFFEAAVAGGIPIIQAIDRGLIVNRVLTLEGILNGTCNYLLTRMERERCSFEVALAGAQAAGFAEADPTLDVSGGDTAHKLAVLAGLALERPITSAQVFTEGIQRITAFDLAWAEQNGFRVKMLGIARFGDGGVELRVHPTLVRRTRLISQVMEEFNAVSVEGDLTGPQLYSGRGAGRMPTASAVVSDIAQALRGESLLRARPARTGNARLIPIGEVVSRHYVHLEVIDQPGVVARVAAALAEKRISIASMFQPDVSHGSQVPLVLTTHPAPDAQIASALEEIRRGSFLVGEPVRIRMEA
jgi:homoserine dehydrogenase